MFPVNKHMALLVWMVMSLVACISSTNEAPSPPHYDLSKPEKFFMPASLLEISGIAFHEGNNDTVYAIQDEEGRLFRLAWQEKKQYNVKFGKKGDYEDVAILKDKVIVLKSNGVLYSIPFNERTYPEAEDVHELKHALPEGDEYEGIYADDVSGKIYVLCKNCMADNSKRAVTGYILEGADSLSHTDRFTIDVSQIKAIEGKVKRGFRPSGLAQNPITKEWFIISAVNKFLVVTDSNWQVKEVYALNGNTFNQPEGIAFDKNGNLYISNEGDDLAEGNILKFVRKEN
jgi:hypothetical protein